MIPQLVAESISKFKPAKSMHVRSVGHIQRSQHQEKALHRLTV
jgi:hypothetical protein